VKGEERGATHLQIRYVPDGRRDAGNSIHISRLKNNQFTNLQKIRIYHDSLLTILTHLWSYHRLLTSRQTSFCEPPSTKTDSPFRALGRSILSPYISFLLLVKNVLHDTKSRSYAKVTRTKWGQKRGERWFHGGIPSNSLSDLFYILNVCNNLI
jgi:hypothetical protein